VLNRTEDVALLVARLLVAALLLPSGIDKLLHFSRFVASLAGKGVPYAKFVAALDVAIEVVGPVALVDVDGLGPGRFPRRDYVDDLPIWHVHRSVPAAAAGPVDEEPRRHGGPPVLRGERTRGLEPNRVRRA